MCPRDKASHKCAPESLGLVGGNPQKLGEHKVHGCEPTRANQAHEVREERQHCANLQQAGKGSVSRRIVMDRRQAEACPRDRSREITYTGCSQQFTMVHFHSAQTSAVQLYMLIACIEEESTRIPSTYFLSLGNRIPQTAPSFQLVPANQSATQDVILIDAQ